VISHIAMSTMFALMAPIVLLAYAVGLGSSAAVGEEESRTLPLLLANPLKRTGVMGAKTVVVIIGIVLITFMTWLAVQVSAAMVGMDISGQNVVAASMQLLGLALLFGGVAIGLSAWRGSSALGIGVAAVLAVASYFISTLLPVVDELADLARLTPWYLYSGAEALSDGVDVVLLAMAIGIGTIMLGLGLYTLPRRDLKG
jgi:putative exporter of polyketide antibiotics